MLQRIVLWLVTLLICSIFTSNLFKLLGRPRRILLDTDVDTDDIFALLYLLKLSRSEFDLQAVTISANSWSDAGHAANQIYDILYMMGRDDVSVGVGGEGGILDDGTILPNVGGYLPIIEQGNTTAGGCRYRQAIPVGTGGRLDTDANFGIRKEFLPQGSRKYTPLQQPTVQQVLIDKVSAGPITILMTGAHTNIAIFLMNNPHLKKNIEHIYVMGGSVRSQNPTSSRGRGNLFTSYSSNPYAEFNMFADPFSAYQVINSGIPIILVPLDATNTIPITENFFKAFEKNQNTYEAQYCYKSLKIVRDTWNESQFYTNYFMWDSFLAGVAASIISISHKSNGENEFSEMEYMNITVVTSNEPYGINDGSNPFFDGHKVPRFHLQRGGIHSGHVQTGLNDPFCKNGKGKCTEGSTREVFSSEGVQVLVATKAKPNPNVTSELSSAFFMNFLDVLNRPEQSGKFNFSTQFQYYKEVYYKPDLTEKKLGKPVIFDMDMSAGDFLALFYLLKVPVEVIDLKAIIVSPTGWANAATIDIVYDILHMMGRDDLPVGLGKVFAMNQSYTLGVGDCKYVRAIPHGRGGFLDSDTLYGLARYLPRSPRRYTAENSIKYGAPRDTDHPELRQPLALEVWESVVRKLKPGSKVTILTNGPLTSLAKIIQSASNASSMIQEVYIVGGHISQSERDRGNVFSVNSNDRAEMNMFLDPFSAKMVFESTIDVILISLGVQRKVSSFSTMISKQTEAKEKTPEALFTRRLLSTLYELQRTNYRYKHLDMFLGEVLGAVLLAGDHSKLKPILQIKPVKVVAEGDESQDGETVVDDKQGKSIRILEDVDPSVYYDLFAKQLDVKDQSAKVGSFEEQTRVWSVPNWTKA